MAPCAWATMASQRDPRYLSLSSAFRPHAPIDDSKLFAGRTQELAQIIDCINQIGRHGLLFGERGVGKTSLARVFKSFLGHGSSVGEGTQTAILVPYVTCDGSDGYATVWHKVFQQIDIVEDRPRMGFVSSIDKQVVSLDTSLSEDCKPQEVVRLLRFIAEAGSLIIVVIDEFDRIGNHEDTALFADTVKALSDVGSDATLILVGVADNVNELIHEHSSVERACAQIRMPRMSHSELGEVVANGLESVGMTIEPSALTYILSLSQRLPHYTHLLGLYSGRSAISDGRDVVEVGDVATAIKGAVAGVEESILASYHSATLTAKRTLYPQVLLACALAKTDELGYFAAGDVRTPMYGIMGKPYEIPTFSRHLHDLSQTRGPILQRIGVPKRYRFRFVNPLMQPFIIMHGLDTGMIDYERLQSMIRESPALQSSFDVAGV